MTTYRRAAVTGVNDWGPFAQEAELEFDDGTTGKAIVYGPMVGEVTAGDLVIANTTAVELGLGSGGQHYVLWNLSRAQLDTGASGHIMKLRYTPLQSNCQTVEEELSEADEADLGKALQGMPVVAGELHSQLLPMAVAYRAARPSGHLVYVMTDGGALPAAFSRTARFLKGEGYLEAVITCGQAFGGDFEAVNVFGALVGARSRCGADAAVVLMGPGIAGTGSRVGFSGMEQAVALNASGCLGGAPIAVPRITFGDARERHRGLSHHTVTVLSCATLIRVTVPVPLMEPEKQRLVFDQLEASGITARHDVEQVDASGVAGLIGGCGIKATVMGRGFEQEPEFFMAAGAAGILAAGTGGE